MPRLARTQRRGSSVDVVIDLIEHLGVCIQLLPHSLTPR
jgi:hypothetical protein